MNKTFYYTLNQKPKWFIINAEGKILGRLATQVTTLLRGKHLTTYSPHINHKNCIIIINAKDIVVTGNKSKQKIYLQHSGQPGGLKIQKFEELQNIAPHKVLKIAIQNMLPKNKLGRRIFRNLRVYSNNIHPHIAQKPTSINL